MSYQLVGEVAAGNQAQEPLQAGETLRIFTGAPLPEGADTVIMQEKVNRVGEQILIKDEKLKAGANVRYQGEQIRKGAVALSKGTRIDVAAIGYLASLGISKLPVSTRPGIAIVVTGNEFCKPGEPLKAGKIYESNGLMLQLALQKTGIEASYYTCEDQPEKMQHLCRVLASEHDLLILTGGVSVGNYDFTRPSLEAVGFETIFHKVAQKPGKPMLFCVKGNKVAFGLPGNPRAVYMTFFKYIYPFLLKSMGSTALFTRTIHLATGRRLQKQSGTRTIAGC